MTASKYRDVDMWLPTCLMEVRDRPDTAIRAMPSGKIKVANGLTHRESFNESTRDSIYLSSNRARRFLLARCRLSAVTASHKVMIGMPVSTHHVQNLFKAICPASL